MTKKIEQYTWKVTTNQREVLVKTPSCEYAVWSVARDKRLNEKILEVKRND